MTNRVANGRAGSAPAYGAVGSREGSSERGLQGAQAPVRIIVADDQRLCRECVRLLIESIDPSLQVVEIDKPQEIAARMGGDMAHSVVLYNLVLTDEQGVEYVGALSQSIGEAPLVVMCDGNEPALMRGCLERGARAFLPSSTPGPLLVSILRLVMAGGVYVPPELALAAHGAKAGSGDAETSRKRNGGNTRRDAVIAEHFPLLTRRQRDVLALLSQGMSNRDIAGSLEMCENTVKAHVKQVMRKLRADNRTQAALQADRLVG